jgi:tetratricopeptide (TPR) repeat protein
MKARRDCALLLAALLAAAMPLAARGQDADALKKQVADLKKEVAALRQEVEQQRVKIEEAQRAQREAEKQRQRTEKELARAAELLGSLGAYLAKPNAPMPVGKKPPTKEQIDEAIKLYRKFTEEQRARERLEAAKPRLQGARDLQSSAEEFQKIGRLNFAEEAYRKAMTVLLSLVAEFPDYTPFRVELARNQVLLGSLQRAVNRPREAEATLRRGVTLLEKLAADFPDSGDIRRDLAGACRHLAAVLGDGAQAEAERLLRRAAELEKQHKARS